MFTWNNIKELQTKTEPPPQKKIKDEISGITKIWDDQLRHGYIPESNRIYDVPGRVFHNTSAFRDFQNRPFKQTEAPQSQTKVHQSSCPNSTSKWWMRIFTDSLSLNWFKKKKTKKEIWPFSSSDFNSALKRRISATTVRRVKVASDFGSSPVCSHCEWHWQVFWKDLAVF